MNAIRIVAVVIFHNKREA